MPDILPIAITILECRGKYLFLQRHNPPYENLWSLVGGKIGAGEHIASAAIREVKEETGASEVRDYSYRGVVSERLIDETGSLLRHFMIFVGHARIDEFRSEHREGHLALFELDEIRQKRSHFLPSDWYMFDSFLQPAKCGLYEAELVHRHGVYDLNYYRVTSC
ncbi:MAG: NUDIX domain-containing protein [Candidatus Thorarchaeota archaeon]|nr:NUDIX domain-containing protein [Candidatus Thorarchaeota archaeon]